MPRDSIDARAQITGRRGVAETMAILSKLGYYAFETPVNAPSVDVVAYCPRKPVTRSFEVRTRANPREKWRKARDWRPKKVSPSASYYYVFVRYEDEHPRSEHFYVVPSSFVAKVVKEEDREDPWITQDEVAEFENKWHEAFHVKGPPEE